MGATAISFTLPGNKTKIQVRKEFRKRRIKDYKKRYKYSSKEMKKEGIHPLHLDQGTSPYSTDFYSFHKINFFHIIAKNRYQAIKYCLNDSEKWVNCTAIKFKEKNKLKWLICGWGPC